MTEADVAFMRRALALAERGRGRTSPNPIVGAIVVRDGVIEGQGAHLAAGTPHAEVHALEAAGSRARGATLYCTLEPCAHEGRTPPCAPRVVDAGVTRTVVAMVDPNPRVAGKGLDILRAGGVAVEAGVLEDEARRANAAFVTWITTRRPHVTVKFARSADGFVGGRVSAHGGGGQRVKLTGAAMDRLMHRQRAEIDAIVVGSGTVLADDPLLTARGAWRVRPLTRVVFDWRLRTSGDRPLFRTLDAGPVVVFTTREAMDRDPASAEDLRERGVEVIALDNRDLATALTTLGAREITSLVVEGGPALQDALAAQRLVDRVQEIVTPLALRQGVRAPSLAVLGGSMGEPRITRAGDDELRETDVHRAD